MSSSEKHDEPSASQCYVEGAGILRITVGQGLYPVILTVTFGFWQSAATRKVVGTSAKSRVETRLITDRPRGPAD